MLSRRWSLLSRLLSCWVLGLVALGAGVYATATAYAQKLPPPVPLVGAIASDAGLTIQLETDGCMKREDLFVALIGNSQVHISQSKPGTCEDHGYQTFLLSWAEIGHPKGAHITTPFKPIPVSIPAKTASAHGKPEKGEDVSVLGYLMEPEALVVAVDSGGCTSLESFQPWVEHGEPSIIHLARVKPDDCEADFPYGEQLRFTWDALGVTSRTAVLANPVLINKAP